MFRQDLWSVASSAGTLIVLEETSHQDEEKFKIKLPQIP